jgi:hypothetical protein
MPKNAKMFECEKCNFTCSKQSNYNNHLSTAKHINRTNRTESMPENANTFECDCGRKYNARNSLWYHKKKCTYIPPSLPPCPENTITYNIEEPVTNEVQELKAMIVDLIKHNGEMQATLREMIPHIGNNNNTNSHNTFNVQLFLENDCKNAQSIQDFVRSIEIDHGHLVAMSKDGYVDTMSNILIQALNKMAVTDRPLHCTDLKRETVYIKDKETWNKSTADAPLMNRVISSIERGCVIEVKNYVDQTPESRELDTPEYQFYHKAHWNTLGAGEDSNKLNKKIYKKVLPQVKLEKQPA